ncbi:MAG: hypothetical protein NVS1B13_11670 [Flavisolibacter sp.]
MVSYMCYENNGKNCGRKAIQLERRLELAMEDYPFFDLQRRDNDTRSMATTLNIYGTLETRSSFYYIANTALFTKGTNDHFAFAQVEINAENSTGKDLIKTKPRLSLSITRNSNCKIEKPAYDSLASVN